MAKGYKKRTDWELVEAVRNGSDDAFTVLVERYQNQIANLAYLSLGSRPDAEDLTQEAFFRFYQTLDRLQKRDSIFPWIYRIAINLCIDESRKRAIRKILSLDFLVDAGVQRDWMASDIPGPDAAMEAGEEQQRILKALGKLPSTYRVVLLMRDFEGLPYSEIADILGVTVQTVKTRIFRARKRLAKILRPEK